MVSHAAPRKASQNALSSTAPDAIEKLEENGARDWIAHRHAEYYHALFERTEGDVRRRPADEWLTDYAQEIDNLRAALAWIRRAYAFTADGPHA